VHSPPCRDREREKGREKLDLVCVLWQSGACQVHEQVVRMVTKYSVFLLLLLFAVQVTPFADNNRKTVTVWESAVQAYVQKMGFYVVDLKLQYMAMAKDESKVSVWCFWVGLVKCTNK
jgi:hypothetical protein